MARYIDAEEYRKRLDMICGDGYAKQVIDVFIDWFMSIAESIESEDVAPVIHAKWKDAKRMTDEIIDWGTCSNCGEDVPLANHCWECGAELEEDDT